MSSTAHDPQINRTTIYISLGLAVLLVLGVLVGARVYFQRVALQPVAMTELPAPEADSHECAALVDDLSLIHISEPTRPVCSSRMPSSA